MYCKGYYEKNKERIKEIQKKHRLKNKNKISIKNKQYHEDHKNETILYYKKYNTINKDRINNVKREWNKNNPEKVLGYKKRYFSKYCKNIGVNTSEFKYALNNWSKVIKKLDCKICKNCDSTKNLHAHHIQPKAQFPELALDLDNGVTLCSKCHGVIHNG